MYRLLLVLLCCPILVLAGDGTLQVPPRQLYIANGFLTSSTGVPLQIHSLRATILGEPPETKSNKGNVVMVTSGTAFLTNAAIAKMLNEKLKERGLSAIQVSRDNGLLKIAGTAKKTITVSFTIEGPLSVTPEGFLRLDAKKMKVGKIPGLADLLGLSPEKVIGHDPGVQADKNSVILNPDLLWGLPIHTAVKRLALQTDGLLLVFGRNK